MEKQNIILPTCSRMKALRGVGVNRRSEILNYAAELTSNMAEVMASSFGPNGLAVLFARDSTASASGTGISPLISRTGLQMLEILAAKNEAKTVHPVLKPLVDSSRILEIEWGDGVKSLVLMVSELLRHCATLECSGRPGWLRRELGKALDLLRMCCESPNSGHSTTSLLLNDVNLHCKKCSHSSDEQSSVHATNVDRLANADSHFVSNHYDEVLGLLKMFFYTRFPSHVVDVVPRLLCEWVKGLERCGRDLDFVFRNFSSLCHVNVGFPSEHSSVIDGMMLEGSGSGHIFTPTTDNCHEEPGMYYSPDCDFNTKRNSGGGDNDNGCAKMTVEIITEHEVCGAFQRREDQFKFKSNHLYFTSYIPSDLVRFEINQLSRVSLIHSVPSDDMDFLRYLIQDQKCFHSGDTDPFYVSWVRWRRMYSSKNSNLIWLGVPRVSSLVLCVPVLGMKDGLKRSCYNALCLAQQFMLHGKHRCVENIKLSLPPRVLDSLKSFKGKPSNNPMNRNVDQTNEESDSGNSSTNVLTLNATLYGEKLLLSHVSFPALENMVATGGLAEVYLHDMLVSSWRTKPCCNGESIDGEVTKAIARSILAVPLFLSAKGRPVRISRQPLTFSVNSKSKELFALRVRIAYYAVSVAFSLSNISDVMLISKSASKMNIISNRKKIDSDDSD